MNKLYVFGDSWPAGAELDLSKERTFGELVAEALNLEFCDYSAHSTSISHVVLQAKYCIERSNTNDTSYALVFLTSPARDLIFSEDGEALEVEPTRAEAYSTRYYKFIYTDQLAEFRANTAILALQRMFKEANIIPVFIWGWDKVDLWQTVDRTKFYPTLAVDMFTKNFTSITALKNERNQYIWPNDGHPNQLGHACIAQNLVKFFKEKFDELR